MYEEIQQAIEDEVSNDFDVLASFFLRSNIMNIYFQTHLSFAYKIKVNNTLQLKKISRMGIYPSLYLKKVFHI